MKRITTLACTLLFTSTSAFADVVVNDATTESITPPSITLTASQSMQQAIASENVRLQPFTARYSSEYDLGWFSLDIDAERKLEASDDGTWQLTFEAEASAASIREKSVFRLDGSRIHPLQYSYDAGGLITEDDQRLVFDYQDETVRDEKKQRSYSDKWQNDLQDKLTYMQQISIDLAAGNDELSYQVFEKHRVREYAFEILGEEQLNTKVGTLNTLKLRQKRNDNREIVAWLAKDKDYLLVRLVDRKKGKKRYQIDLVSTTL